MEAARKVIDHLEEKKGEDLVLIDIKNQAIFADYFIICSGTSDRMLHALANSVTDFIDTNYRWPVRIEGESREGWILIDAGDIIIHLFSPERRSYYKLEDLWSKGKILLHLQ